MPSPKTTAVEANKKEPVIYREHTYMMWKVKWQGGGEIPARLSGVYSSYDEAQRDVSKYLQARG